MASPLLIRNGLVIDTEPSVQATGQADVLVRDGRIAAVAAGLGAPEDTEVIDATGCIVLPGFVDTHRHTWQAALKAVASDMTLPGYAELVIGGHARRYRPDDVHTGTLAGALDALGSGVTTLLDWSHIQLSPDHTAASFAALTASGIRAIFGYCHGGRDDLQTAGRRVHRELPDGLQMVLAATGPEFGTDERAREEWRLARDLGLQISVHMGGHDPETSQRGLAFLEAEDLFVPGTTYIHPNYYTDEDLKRIAGSGGTASIAPISEAVLHIGYPATGRLLAAGIPTSLSADSVACGPGDMFEIMRTAYYLERARPDRAGLGFTTADVLRLATLGGAEVLGLAAETGSLRPGKRADLILVRTDGTTLADPIRTLVLAARVTDVDTVLVGGHVVKRDGRLTGHDPAAVHDALRESATRLSTGD